MKVTESTLSKPISQMIDQISPQNNFHILSHGSITSLENDLTGFRISTDPLYADFSLEYLFSQSIGCQKVKDSEKRQVFLIQTPDSDYFLKLSRLIRDKDRFRHAILPQRKWAEWKNLKRFQRLGITAAEPIAKGSRQSPPPENFFILTKKINGRHVNGQTLSEAKALGRYIAHLHSRGIYHADLHPENIIIAPKNQPFLIDVQEVFFLHHLPRRLRIYNLGKFFFQLDLQHLNPSWMKEFIKAYNEAFKHPITKIEVEKAAVIHFRRRLRSRTNRCCKNSTEFEVIRKPQFKGYKKRNFNWGRQELEKALLEATSLKEDKVFKYHDVCIKIHPRKLFHCDRCFTSWKVSRALEILGIPVPQAYAYFKVKTKSYFLSELLIASMTLNDYLSSLTNRQEKRQAIIKFALWMKKIHDHQIRQRDFKSSNVLCKNGEYFMIDLDSVKIGRLTDKQRIINLAQLNASLSNMIACKDRLRFFYYYAATDEHSRNRRRSIYKKVWEISQTKNTKIFNLDLKKI